MFAKIFELIAAFKAKNWKACVKLAGEILVMAADFIPGPSDVATAAVLSDEALVAKLEATCHAGTEPTFSAIPWAVLWPILSEIIKRILDRAGSQ